jgi:hypothetical protein
MQVHVLATLMLWTFREVPSLIDLLVLEAVSTPLPDMGLTGWPHRGGSEMCRTCVLAMAM